MSVRSLLLLALVSGCATLAEYGVRPSPGPEAADRPEAQDPEAEVTLVTLTGTVTRVDLEGGFWGLRGDDGRRYALEGLPGQWHKDGLRVRLRGHVFAEENAASRWGTVLEVVEASAP